MPNLQLSEKLREKYSSSRIESQIKMMSKIKALNESVTKKFSLGQTMNLFVERNLDKDIIEYLEKQKNSDVVLLFIDITDFSTKCEGFSDLTLEKYLDTYYEEVIKLIYKHGGEIEKIIGDGIICLFGEPFTKGTKTELLKTADTCAKEIIMTLSGTNKEVKIALHQGSIRYYKNKSQDYPEYTMIGKSLTELFRLEGVAHSNSINFYDDSSYDLTIPPGDAIVQNGKSYYWRKSSTEKISLKGVNKSGMKKYECFKLT